MACHNEKELFNKIMLVNPPSLTQLKQMPNRKDRLLKAALEIPIFGTLVYHMIVSRDNINNLFIEKMYYNPFHVDNQWQMLIMKQLIKVDIIPDFVLQSCS